MPQPTDSSEQRRTTARVDVNKARTHRQGPVVRAWVVRASRQFCPGFRYACMTGKMPVFECMTALADQPPVAHSNTSNVRRVPLLCEQCFANNVRRGTAKA